MGIMILKIDQYYPIPLEISELLVDLSQTNVGKQHQLKRKISFKSFCRE
jgi:hypothetical protein